jgi:nucleoid DNA-binding protein
VPVPERNVPVFKVSKELKDLVAATNPVEEDSAAGV